MLKIKDNVDLKELEKYGFEYYSGDKAYVSELLGDTEWLEIDIDTRQIRIFIDDEYYNCYTKNDTLELLYDLIKADLVDKVEENK